MKKCFLFLVVLTLLFGCSKEDDLTPPINKEQEPEQVPEQVNLPPENFEITLAKLSSNSAKISWEEAIDPENEKVTYSVLLDNKIVLENTQDRSYEFLDLSELTEYNSKIIAKDQSGNEVAIELRFTTKKFYLQFLIEYSLGSIESGSFGSATNMIRTFQGDYVIAGSATKATGGYQSFVKRIDQDGNVIWTHYYGNEVNQTTNITQTRDGGFILVAFHMILKIDANGNEVWRTVNNNYINPDYSFLVTLGEMYAAKEDTEGNIFVVGYRGLAVPEPDFYHFGVLTKLNSTGEILWEKEFKDSNRSTFNDLVFDENNNVIILGTANTSNQGELENINYWILKTDKSGEILWSRNKTVNGYAFSRKIIKTRDGNYVMAGQSWGAYDIAAGIIFKLSPDGSHLWSGEVSLSSVIGVHETYSGDLMAIGHVDTSGFDVLGISRISSGGTEQWTKVHRQEQSHLRGRTIFETEDEGYIFLGNFSKNYYYNNEYAKIQVYKTDPEGDYQK